MAKSRRKALTFLVDQMELAERLLSREELGDMYAALRPYAMDGSPPDLTGKSQTWSVVFDLLAHAQDKAEILYQEACERNRAAANTRWHGSSR